MERMLKLLPYAIPKMISDKRFRMFVILFLASVIIWFGGPYIAIAGNSFLASINHRLIAILLLAIFWGIGNLRIQSKDKSEAVYPKNKSELIATEINPTQNKVINVEIKLQKKIFKKTLRLIKKSILPAYLILGQNQSGKTSLLTQANPENPLPLASEKYYDCWLVNNAVFFDYIFAAETASAANSLSLWNHFIKLLARYRRKLRFRGIIITIDLSQFFNEKSAFDFDKICQQLQEVTVVFQQLPIYLIFTHCDLIAGFTDFFEDLSQEERGQALGFSFPNIKTSRNMTEIFALQFNMLLKRLNERLIWRLHQEHNLQKRERIKDFPLQLEILKNSLASMINQINNITAVKLCGCYFTSNSQQQMPINFLKESLEKTFQLKQYQPNIQQKIPQQKSYFTTQLFTQITESYHEIISSKSHLFSYIIYGAAFLLVVSCSGYWYRNYKENMIAIQELQQAIAESKNNYPQNSPYAFLSTLNALAQALVKINSSHSEQLIQTAKSTYHDLLVTHFLPVLKNILETNIQIAINNKTSDNLYSTLKAYLMLTDLAHRDPQFIKQWFATYWQQQLPDNIVEQKELVIQLNQILQQSLTFNGDQKIIATARNNLNQIPLAQLSYSVLLDHYRQPVKIFDKNNAITIKDNYTIPALFTAKNFNDIYNHQITNACQEVLSGNWVLGQKSIDSSTINLDQLVNQLQTLYLNQYANAWSTLISKLSLNDFENLQQLSDSLQTLTNSDSPLWQLLNAISNNTAPNNLVQFNLSVSNKFQDLDTFIKSSALGNFQNTLNANKNYFEKISKASNSDKVAFAAAVKRMDMNSQNDALENLFQQIPNLPQPLQNWGTAIAKTGWHLLLLAAQNHINQVWTATVIPKYQEQLDNKYPLFKNSSNDINLVDFTQFFAPDGVIDDFFKTYLKSFVDTQNVYWVWKTVDNDRINIPQTTLEMFIRAALIQKMYFADANDQPFVKFTLVPMAIEPGVVDFNLNLEGQIIDFQPNHLPQVAALIWPGPDPDKVTMQFTNDQGRLSVITETGSWALFRLLQKATVETTLNNPKQFKITFDLNGNSVKYQLIASNLVNPFITGIVDVFRCPQKL